MPINSLNHTSLFGINPSVSNHIDQFVRAQGFYIHIVAHTLTFKLKVQTACIACTLNNTI